MPDNERDERRHTLTLTRSDGTTCEVRTRLKWRSIDIMPHAIETAIARYDPGRDLVVMLTRRFVASRILDLADDLRAIQEAMK